MKSRNITALVFNHSFLKDLVNRFHSVKFDIEGFLCMYFKWDQTQKVSLRVIFP